MRALAIPPADSLILDWLGANTLVLRLLLAAASGALLALPFILPTSFVLSWFAFVPLLLAIENTRLRTCYLCGLVMGLVFYCLATHWVVEFLLLLKEYGPLKSYLFALVIWFYSAQLPALLALSYAFIRRRSKTPPTIIFPLLVVGFYSLFPLLFSAKIGESQSHFIWALQAIEFTGVYGLDFLIALVNVCLALFLQRRLPRLQLLALISLLLLWFGYGCYATNQWDNFLKDSPTKAVGFVQPNQMASIEAPQVLPGYGRAYPPEMEMTERLAAAGATLVAWPESHYKGYYEDTHIRAAYEARVAELGVPLLFQDMEKVDPRQHDSRYYNTAFFIDGNGELAGRYHKIKRVAFGEKLPLVDDLPWLKALVKTYFGDFFREIQPGDKPAVFEAADFRVVPLICYETMFSIFTARATPDDGGNLMLVGLSSDGWFGRTRQPYQHLYISSLRAVENRLPMLHVLNNGPSGLVLPSGRIAFETAFDEAGGYLVDVPLANRGGSFFSRHPVAFIGAVYLALAVLAAATLLRRSPKTVATVS